MKNVKDVRSLFLEFFSKSEFNKQTHKIYPSMPLVPDDASLLFTNAGMVQFKDIFTGKIPAPSTKIATSSQLCIRAGGKHNDLENVGYTSRHHTLFEMLGNFSFGAYFKREAIGFAWDFVTRVLGFSKDVLYITIHESDDEAYEIWSEFVEKNRIKRMGDKDNFWQMGDTGPCGPCSEIYVDQGAEHFSGPEDYFGGEGDRFLEIWNLVFMQFERDSSGELHPLPKPSIDTGMGLERVVALLEGKRNNFDTSLFAPIMREIEKICGKTYFEDSEFDKFTSSNGTLKGVDSMTGAALSGVADNSTIAQKKSEQASFRVISDHARSVAFLLAQGVNFDKEGRGYVLRRILRRAVRHGYLLGLREPFLYKVVGAVCDCMSDHYEYLAEKKDNIKEQCKAEEARFFETIENGMALFEKEFANLLAARSAENKAKFDKNAQFSGEVAFKLYDTYGFPLDLTQDMLRESGIGVDIIGFEACMSEQKARAKAAWKGSGDASVGGDFKEILAEFGENEFIGHTHNAAKAQILALLDKDFKRVKILQNSCSTAKSGEKNINEKNEDEENFSGYVLLDKTPFYPESGGPVGDSGALCSLDSIPFLKEIESKSRLFKTSELKGKIAEVLDTKKYFGLNLSKVRLCGDYKLEVGAQITAFVEIERRVEIAKHHSATHLLHRALREILGTHIAQAGSLVEFNRLRFDFSHPRAISADELAQIESRVNEQILAANPQICEQMGIDEAKQKGAMALFGEKYGDVVRVISFGDSIELCGGIHTPNTAHIGSFYITKESGVSSGVRRIEAVCGKAAYEFGKAALMQIQNAKDSLKAQDLLAAINKLKEQNKELKNAAKSGSGAAFSEFAFESLKSGAKLIVSKSDNENIKESIDELKNRENSVAVLLISPSGKIAAGVKNENINAGAWVKNVAEIMGGKGGGRADFATAGGKDLSKIESALKAAIDFAKNNV